MVQASPYQSSDLGLAGSQPSSKRQSPDEDSSSTIGVAGIVGLGLAVAGFIGLNLSANNTAKDFAKSAAEKANDIPAAISGKLTNVGSTSGI